MHLGVAFIWIFIGIINLVGGNWISLALNLLCIICWLFVAKQSYTPWKIKNKEIMKMEADNANFHADQKSYKENIDKLNFFKKS